MGWHTIIFVVLIYPNVIECMADFYLEFATPYYDEIFFDRANQKKTESWFRKHEHIGESPSSLKVKMYLFQCEEDEAAPRSQSEEMPVSCFLITDSVQMYLVYATYNFYHVDWPKLEKQSIRFVDFADTHLPSNLYVGIKIVNPPYYPKFLSRLTSNHFKNRIQEWQIVPPSPANTVFYENNLILYFSQTSLLKFISEPYVMLRALTTFRYVLENIDNDVYQPGQKKTLVTAFLPRMIDPCFLGRLMSEAATEQGAKKELIPRKDRNNSCKVYCKFLIQSLSIMKKEAPHGCNLKKRGKCVKYKCFCFPVIRKWNERKPSRKRPMVSMLFCHNSIRIKLLRHTEMQAFKDVQMGFIIDD